MTRSQLRSRQIVTTVYLHPCAGVWYLVCLESLRLCANSEFNEVKGHTLLGIADEKDLSPLFTSLACRSCSPPSTPL